MTAPASPLSRPLAPELLALAARQRGGDGRAEIRCAGCGYGAIVAHLPERCPMCGSTSWEAEGWKPYAALLGVTAEMEERSAEEATAPLQREASELGPGSILPGVPFS
jgi:ribosomal protein S27AE